MLLRERYEDYAKHAKLMTGIHALKAGGATDAATGADAADTDTVDADVLAKKRAAEKKDDKRAAEKKRSLKRL